MEDIKWGYEKLDEKTGKIKSCPMHDLDGKITGRRVYGLKAWFDENPDERIRLGWTKHLYKDTKKIPYNHQTQYLDKSVVRVDDWTVEDVYYVVDKSEEMMRIEELTQRSNLGGGIYWEGVDDDD